MNEKRATYVKPSVQTLGSVAALTTSGTIPGKENMGDKADELP